MRSRVQQQLSAIATGASLHRRRRGTEHLHAAQRFLMGGSERRTQEFHGRERRSRFCTQQRDARERRPLALFALPQRALSEGFVAALQQ